MDYLRDRTNFSNSKITDGGLMPNSKEYNRKYQAEKRHIVCNTIRGTKEDQEIINWHKCRKGLTWLQIMYRGLAVKRPETIVSVPGPIKASKTTPEDARNPKPA